MKNAFSLVELSIVLVILGLLTGGILAGQSLIRAAELRSVITDYQRFNAAVFTFRDKYFELPGDMRKAYDFWNTETSCINDATVTAANPDGCNGDGDGAIEYLIGEQFKAWSHLTYAGLIEGAYNGQYTSLGNFQRSVNVPPSKVNGTNYWLLYDYRMSARGYTTGSNVNNNVNRLYNGGPSTSSFLIEEVWNIDKKLDDGKPGLGLVNAYATCTVGDNTNTDTAEYDIANTSDRCPGVDLKL